MIKLIYLFPLLFISLSQAKTIKIGSGGIAGHYYTLASNFCKSNTPKGQVCEVVETSGTVDNIELLQARKIDYALIQSNLYTDNLQFVKNLGEEGFYIFYKNLPQKPQSFKHLMSMVGSDYSYDIKSGSFAILQKVAIILGQEILGNELTIKDKYNTFCERDTKLSIYNISNTSLVFQQMSLCGDYYKFKPQEITELESVFEIKNGVITNTILLVK